jgi:hypothetical protein
MAQGQHTGQLTWFAQDPRLELRPELITPETLDLAWPDLTQQAEHDGKKAVVWMRGDLEIHDHFLIDRILELDAGVWQITDPQGSTLLKAATSRPPGSKPLPVRTLPISVAVPNARTQVGPTLQDEPELLVVTASRVDASSFYTQTALGRSIQRLRQHGARIRLMAICNNWQALAHAYNRVLTPEHLDSLVAFIHDDVTLHDWHLGVHVRNALKHFDLIGVAGCKLLRPQQPSWAFPEKVGRWAPPQELLGAVGHDTRDRPQSTVKVHLLTRYGAPRGAAVLLDGVFLASTVKTLTEHGLQFDPDLPFHFYDLDLCRQAQRASLRAGVWPLAITHHSGGHFNSPEWLSAYRHYLQKWEPAG